MGSHLPPERRARGLIVPVADVVSTAFDKQTSYDEAQELYIDADDPSHALGYQQVRSLVRKLVAGLRGAGLQPGCAVLVHLGNDYLYSTIFLAIIGAGGVYCGSNPAYHFLELDHVVHLSTPQIVITNRETLATVLEVCDVRGVPRDCIFVYDQTSPLDGTGPGAPAGLELAAHTGARPFTDLLCYGEQDWVQITTVAAMKSTPAAYYPTSGTSGLPKLATHSHYSLVAQHIALHTEPTSPYAVCRLACLPLFHCFGATWAHLAPLRFGQPLFVMRRFELEAFVTNVARHAVTTTSMVPPMVYTLLTSPARDACASLRDVTVAGAPIDAPALKRLRERLHPEATLSQLWGMTELGAGLRFPRGENDESGSVGRPLPGCEVKIVDGEGCGIRAEGAAGELLVRSLGMMMGYRNLKVDEKEKGWFHTGDLAYIRGGRVYIVGRVKELIKVRGWQVPPAELEAVLLQHPGICDCAVVGTFLPDGMTEVPRAYVVRRKMPPEAGLTAHDVFEFARWQLASYKRLDGGVFFVDSIPRTASGKTQRFKLLQIDHAATSSVFQGRRAAVRSNPSMLV